MQFIRLPAEEPLEESAASLWLACVASLLMGCTAFYTKIFLTCFACVCLYLFGSADIAFSHLFQLVRCRVIGTINMLKTLTCFINAT